MLLFLPMNKLIHAIGVLFVLISMILATQSKATCWDGIFADNGFIAASSEDDKLISLMAEVKAEEARYGVAPNDQTEFYFHRDMSGQLIRTGAVVVIYHGLLNSPSYTRWLAQQAFEKGANVINVRLTKHNHKRRRDLNTITADDIAKQVRQMNQIAELLGDNIIQAGHSAGGLSAIYAAMESKKSSAMFVYAPALQVTDKTWWSSYLIGRTFISNSIINMTSDDPRYLSAASGRATDRFSNRLQGARGTSEQYQRDFGLMIEMLSRIGNNIFWIDTENDQTIIDGVNQEVANQIPEINYYLVPKENGLAHVKLMDDPASLEPESQKILQQFTDIFLNHIESYN